MFEASYSQFYIYLKYTNMKPFKVQRRIIPAIIIIIIIILGHITCNSQRLFL
jgi:hypothetical protein